MLFDEFAQTWNTESTIKSVLLHGVQLWKWEAYAFHAGWVDGSKWSGTAIADYLRTKRDRTLGRARISQILKEVEDAFNHPLNFSPHNPLFRRAVYTLFSYVVMPKVVTSAQRYIPHENDEFVCGEQIWRWCGTSTYKGWKHLKCDSLEIDLSWLDDSQGRLVTGDDDKLNRVPVCRNRKSVFIFLPSYVIVWGSNRAEDRDPYCDAPLKSRYMVLLFNCGGDFYFFDDFIDLGGGRSKVLLKPVTYSFPPIGVVEPGRKQ